HRPDADGEKACSPRQHRAPSDIRVTQGRGQAKARISPHDRNDHRKRDQVGIVPSKHADTCAQTRRAKRASPCRHFKRTNEVFARYRETWARRAFPAWTTSPSAPSPLQHIAGDGFRLAAPHIVSRSNSFEALSNFRQATESPGIGFADKR